MIRPRAGGEGGLVEDRTGREGNAVALQSATLAAARLLRMEGRLGRREKGHLGDLLAAAGNPLLDIRTLESPVLVMD